MTFHGFVIVITTKYLITCSRLQRVGRFQYKSFSLLHQQWLYYRVFVILFLYYIRYQYRLYNVPEIYLIAVSAFRLIYLQKERIGNILNANEKKRYRPRISKSGPKKYKERNGKRHEMCLWTVKIVHEKIFSVSLLENESSGQSGCVKVARAYACSFDENVSIEIYFIVYRVARLLTFSLNNYRFQADWIINSPKFVRLRWLGTYLGVTAVVKCRAHIYAWNYISTHYYIVYLPICWSN